MSRAYLGIGSNLDPERNVRAALAELRRALNVLAISTFYRTRPIGREGDPEFINGVIAVEENGAGSALEREVLRPIEARLGRQRSEDRDAPRPIDVDLLLTERASGLKTEATPPRLREIESRAFIAWPLCELLPSLVLPDGQPIAKVA
ncbi:MAG: 2-amino-4-hydroxy-6-hydroxymethyldihydropteridine diphosphokinase, partial [Polyangia bacterium]